MIPSFVQKHSPIALTVTSLDIRLILWWIPSPHFSQLPSPAVTNMGLNGSLIDTPMRILRCTASMLYSTNVHSGLLSQLFAQNSIVRWRALDYSFKYLPTNHNSHLMLHSSFCVKNILYIFAAGSTREVDRDSLVKYSLQRISHGPAMMAGWDCCLNLRNLMQHWEVGQGLWENHWSMKYFLSYVTCQMFQSELWHLVKHSGRWQMTAW